MNENYDGFILSRGFNKRKKSVFLINHVLKQFKELNNFNQHYHCKKHKKLQYFNTHLCVTTGNV